MYVRGGLLVQRTVALFGIGRTLVHNVIYTWANILCDKFKVLFAVPICSQMLCAYPKTMVRKLGYAGVFMMLDATECNAETASMKRINAILYASYNHHTTLQWLFGCNYIGTM